jgi:hypothetical protein
MANNEQDAGNSGTTTPPVGKAKVVGHPYDESHQGTHGSNKKLKAGIIRLWRDEAVKSSLPVLELW